MTEHEKELVKKYYKKASKQPEISELKKINEYSFSFKFADEYFIVAFSEDDDTMIISDGLGDPFSNDRAHELSLYEIEELSF